MMKTTPKKSAATIKKRIFVVDDHPMTRYGIAQLINAESDLEVCGETDNARRVVAAVKSLEPDLVLLDLTLPGKNGIELIKDLKAQLSQVLVLVVSMHDENIYAERALKAGANGYLMKSEGGQRLLEAIRQVLKGQVCISDIVSSRIVAAFTGSRKSAAPESTLSVLSEREFQVFELLGNGLTIREIGQHLCISAKTVESHRLHIVEKLRMTNTAELTRFAIHWMRSQSVG